MIWLNIVKGPSVGHAEIRILGPGQNGNGGGQSEGYCNNSGKIWWWFRPTW